MNDQIKAALVKLFGAFANGFSHAVLAFFGSAGAEALGTGIPHLTWKQALAVACTSGGLKLFGVMEKMTSKFANAGNTEFIQKP